MKTQIKLYATKTRNTARVLTNALKAQGYNAVAPTKKTGAGWLVSSHKALPMPTPNKVFKVVSGVVQAI
jgi:hypothetical protein